MINSLTKIRFFFLQAIFLFAPLIYAWFYIPGVGHTLADLVNSIFPQLHWSGFESIKVHYVILMTACILVLSIPRFFFWKKSVSSSFLMSILVVAIWSITSYTLNHATNPYFFTGNFEKTHGWVFYISLFALFWILHGLSRKEKKSLFLMSFLGFI